MPDRNSLPDFLGIGAARCGTTWLHEHLGAHPDLWLPPVKELHYFDRSPSYASPSHLGAERLRDRMFGTAAHHREWRRVARRDLSRAPRHPATLPWKLRYYLGRPDDAWYASLFRPAGERRRGEITPGYSVLRRDDVQRVHALAPEAKIIFMIRNPIDRTWSRYRRLQLSDDQIRRRMTSPEIDRRTDYLTILDTWESVFGAQQMFVGFYDDIELDPADLLSRVCCFLEVPPPGKAAGSSLAERVNAAPDRPMPSDVRTALTRRHLDMMAALAERLGGHAAAWVADAEASLTESDSRRGLQE